MCKRLADLDRQRLVLNEHLESQPVRHRHEPRERHLARRGVEEGGDEARGQDAIVGCSSEARMPTKPVLMAQRDSTSYSRAA